MRWLDRQGVRASRGGATVGAQEYLCDVFIKIGGSILDRDDLTSALAPYITAVARQHRIMILPGGGQAVKRIKVNQNRYGTDFRSCWIPAVLCLDVNAGILASYSPAFSVVTCAEEITACFESGNVAVFAAAGAVFNSLHLPPDFTTTTDSMGLYYASALGARRYVVISNVDGIYRDKSGIDSGDTPISHLTADELEQLPTSKLDPSFPDYLRRYPIATIIVNGKHPERVSAAIHGSPTIGTRVGALSL